MMKQTELTNAMLGIWCAITSFLSPVWLTMGFLDITGRIYQYDGMVDQGTAGIMGVFELALWIGIALLPAIWFLKRMKVQGGRKVLCAAGGMVILALLCMALCQWDVVGFVAG